MWSNQIEYKYLQLLLPVILNDYAQFYANLLALYLDLNRTFTSECLLRIERP